jgi:hypothetical protein
MQQPPCSSSSQTSASDGYNSSGGITGPEDRELVLFNPIERYFGRAPILNPPSNHIDCETPYANSHLRLEEPLLFRIWSRDISRGAGEVDDMLDIYATTASLDRRSLFANLGDTISSFADYGMRSGSGEASGSQPWPFAVSDNWQPNFEPDFPENAAIYAPDEQWSLCDSCSQSSLQH